MRRLLCATALVLASCAGVEVSTGGLSLPECDIVVNHTWPADGATGVYYRDPIEFSLSAPVPQAVVVADFPGIQDVSDDGLVISYTPDPPLDPASEYRVALDYCVGTPEISFVTSPLGEALEEDVWLEGRTWVMDPAGGEYLEGDGLANIMAAVFDRALIAEIVEVDGTEMLWRLGVSTEDGQRQDECFRTVDVVGVDFSEAPYFQFNAERVDFGAFNGELSFYDFSLDGTISSDGEVLGGINYRVTIDVEDLVSVMKLSDAQTLCEHAENLGSACGPCPNGDAQTCTTIVARDLLGTPVNGPVNPVEESNTAEDCPAE